jgi:hypothetical protein
VKVGFFVVRVCRTAHIIGPARRLEMKKISSISIWLAAGFLIAWVGPGEFGLGNRDVQAAGSLEVDRQQILDLISRYSYDWDAKDAEAFTGLFQDRANLSTYSAGVLSTTLQSNKERLARAQERFQAFTAQGIQTRHFQTNTILERLSDGSVRGETLFQVLWQYAKEPSPKLVHSGMYRDVFTKTSSGGGLRAARFTSITSKLCWLLGCGPQSPAPGAAAPEERLPRQGVPPKSRNMIFKSESFGSRWPVGNPVEGDRDYGLNAISVPG